MAVIVAVIIIIMARAMVSKGKGHLQATVTQYTGAVAMGGITATLGGMEPIDNLRKIILPVSTVTLHFILLGTVHS